MVSDAYIQIRTALDSTTEVTGGDSRTGVGAVFIRKDFDRMIVDAMNRETDFRQLVPRKTMRQRARIWNLRTSLGSTSKAAVYSEGATGTPYPQRFLQLYAPAISYRSDYEITGMVKASSESYFDALADEAKAAASSLALLEEQMMILGDDTSAEATGLTITATVGVASGFKGLKQLLSSAVAVAAGSTGGFADASTAYGSTRSSTVTDREYKLNVKTVCASATATSDLRLSDMDSAMTESDIAGGKRHRRIWLMSERRLDKLSQELQPQGRFAIGADVAELDGGVRVMRYRGLPIITSRYMGLLGVTSTNGTSVTFADDDNCCLLLDMDYIYFWNVSGVDTQHIPVLGADASQRSDVEGGWFKTYGVFTVERFDTQAVIWNLTTL